MSVAATGRGPKVALVGIAAGVVLVDQGSKQLAASALGDGKVVDLLGSWLRLELTHNSGAAFSLGSQATWVLSLVAAVIVVVTLWQVRKLGSWGWAWALGLVLGGAIGNLIDRLVRPPGPGRGHVVDFIAYGDWFIGNVADIAIVAGALVLVGLSVKGVAFSGHPTEPAQPPESLQPTDPSHVAETRHSLEPDPSARPGPTFDAPDARRSPGDQDG